MAKSDSNQAQPGNERWLELVRQHVSSLQFGTVLITVQDSRVLQIERTEKLRLDQPDDRQLARVTPRTNL